MEFEKIIRCYILSELIVLFCTFPVSWEA